MFLQSLVKLNNSISFWNFALKFRWRPKKKNSSPHFGSNSVWNFGFLVASGYYLPKNRGGQTYFAPFSVRPKGAPLLPPPKSMPMYQCIIKIILVYWYVTFETPCIKLLQWLKLYFALNTIATMTPILWLTSLLVSKTNIMLCIINLWLKPLLLFITCYMQLYCYLLSYTVS